MMGQGSDGQKRLFCSINLQSHDPAGAMPRCITMTAQPMPATRRRKLQQLMAVAEFARVQRNSASVGLLRIRLVPIVPDPLLPLIIATNL